ncbi:hypothetical protein JL09_g6075 [Pichia kudriavzevii]|uniref:Uncharacterized protein n=1 Tax=Pichia kudriavzevii TaxID=4909 RepID=A0A099NS94_PICKU|nr:hypothetical protein JL09_g6075 [Pichia kudriavzevii]
MIRSIFKVIDAFEHLGIHPNKDTLHLLIYKLNDIKGLRWRKDLLNFYVLLGTRKWGVSPDKTTEVLSAIQSPPGRPRLAITKRLINEGIDDSYFQNTMFHDYVTIEIESQKQSQIPMKTK